MHPKSITSRPAKQAPETGGAIADGAAATARSGTFDAAAEVARLKAQTRARRARVRTPSRLDRHTHELLAMRAAGATTAELQRWLLAHNIGVQHSTVARWLRRNGAD